MDNVDVRQSKYTRNSATNPKLNLVVACSREIRRARGKLRAELPSCTCYTLLPAWAQKIPPFSSLVAFLLFYSDLFSLLIFQKSNGSPHVLRTLSKFFEYFSKFLSVRTNISSTCANLSNFHVNCHSHCFKELLFLPTECFTIQHYCKTPTTR